MMSIIWLSGSNWRLPTALLAPAELRARRALWIPDKNHKSITKMRNTTATGTVAGYSISREGITVHPGVTQMTPVHSQNNSSVTQMAPVHSQNNSSVRSLGSGARGVARVILRLLERPGWCQVHGQSASPKGQGGKGKGWHVSPASTGRVVAVGS